MSYSAPVSAAKPTCFLFLVDQSLSMKELLGSTAPNRPNSESPESIVKRLTSNEIDSAKKLDSSDSFATTLDNLASGMPAQSKADFVAAIINRFLNYLVFRCSTAEGGPQDYFFVGLLGYGSPGGSGFGGSLLSSDLVPISELARTPLTRGSQLPDPGSVLGPQMGHSLWLAPTAAGGAGTPMRQVLTYARAVIARWLIEHPDGFPPIVINLTDGEPTDGDPLPAAEELKQLCSSDGAVLLFNCHISSLPGRPIQFPSSTDGLPDAHAARMFQMSSVLPPNVRSQAAKKIGRELGEGARGFTFQADMAAVAQFIDIGVQGALLAKGSGEIPAREQGAVRLVGTPTPDVAGREIQPIQKPRRGPDKLEDIEKPPNEPSAERAHSPHSPQPALGAQFIPTHPPDVKNKPATRAEFIPATPKVKRPTEGTADSKEAGSPQPKE